MQSDKHIFDDIAKVFNGLAGTVAGMGREAQDAFREKNREWAGGFDLVSREEFDAVKAMASKAREEAEALGARVAVLEAALGKAVPKAAAAKPAAKKKPAAKA